MPGVHHERSRRITLTGARLFDFFHPEPQQDISSLPPETLGHIFVCVQARSDGRKAFPPSKVGKPLAVSQVCRHWRQVALCTPQLWNHIHVPRPDDELAIESFFRSGALPLWVDFVFEYPESTCQPTALDMILANMHRIKQFSVHAKGRWSCGSPDWSALRLSSAKALKNLQLSTDAFQPLPIDIFGNLCRQIEELTLSNYSPLLPCDQHFQLHNLKRLHLNNSGNGLGASLHLCDYLPLISSAPQLEDLLISQTGEAPAPPDPSPNTIHFFDTPTALPQLRSLTLGSKTTRIDDALQFLSCIHTPDTATCHIFASSWSEWPDNSLSDLIHEGGFTNDSSGSTSLGCPIRGLQITSSREVGGRKAFGLEGGTLSFTANLSWNVRNSLLQSGLLNEVEALVLVDLPGYYSTAELSPLFTALPSLRHLTVSENTPSSTPARIVDALGCQSSSAANERKGFHGVGQTSRSLCPSLESILFLYPKSADGTPDAVLGIDEAALALLAEERGRRGSPLKLEVETIEPLTSRKSQILGRVDSENFSLKVAFERLQSYSLASV